MTWKDRLAVIDAWMLLLMGESWASKQATRLRLAQHLAIHAPGVDPALIAQLVERWLNPETCLRVSDHAFRRWRERARSTESNDEIIARLRTLEATSVLVKVRSQTEHVRRLIRHGCEEAEYRRAEGWILVILDREVKTVYKALKGDWKLKEEKVR